tara:strand:+ start:2694 stop:3203 length:510 start_codon:yes stop_codon:yes gene_type:complete
MTSFDLQSEQDRFNEECAVFGVYGSSEAHELNALSLHALQHRGQEVIGMVSFDGKQFNSYRSLGHVGDNFNAGSPNQKASKGHMRIASPPTTNPCFYGVDTPDSDKLMAAQMSITKMCKEIGTDSLTFLSITGLYRAMGETSRHLETPQFCDACFTGDYPVKEFFSAAL